MRWIVVGVGMYLTSIGALIWWASLRERTVSLREARAEHKRAAADAAAFRAHELEEMLRERESLIHSRYGASAPHAGCMACQVAWPDLNIVEGWPHD